MATIDVFTRKRLHRFIEEHRSKSGQLPRLQDFERAGFAKELVKQAERAKAIEEFYLTLSNGTVVKGYKIGSGE